MNYHLPKELDNRFQRAFDYFNRELFSGELPWVKLDVAQSEEHKACLYDIYWGDDSENLAIAYEIYMHFDFSRLGLRYNLSVLVHEQAHVWQCEHGESPDIRGDHDAQLIGKMDSLGLRLDNHKGGKTGRRVTHHVIDGGAFDRAFLAVPKEIGAPWQNLSEFKWIAKAETPA